MASALPTPACQGRISGRISKDIRGAMFMPLHGTCLSGTDIRSDIRGYPTISYAFRTTRQGNSWGLPRGPGRERPWNQGLQRTTHTRARAHTSAGRVRDGRVSGCISHLSDSDGGEFNLTRPRGGVGGRLRFFGYESLQGRP